MLINLSNHPSKDWGKTQKTTATETYTNIYDMEFPKINPAWEITKVKQIVDKYYDKTIELLKENYKKNETNAVHIMGEHTFVYHLVNKLKSSGITCIASTTQRIVQEKNEKKITEFKFVRFREF